MVWRSLDHSPRSKRGGERRLEKEPERRACAHGKRAAKSRDVRGSLTGYGTDSFRRGRIEREIEQSSERQSFFTISFSGIAERTLTTAQSKRYEEDEKEA